MLFGCLQLFLSYERPAQSGHILRIVALEHARKRQLRPTCISATDRADCAKMTTRAVSKPAEHLDNGWKRRLPTFTTPKKDKDDPSITF